MRITIDEDIHGELIAPCERAHVWLDGVKQWHVICADDITGEIVRVKIDERGYPEHIEGELIRETVKGEVKIQLF